MNGDSPPKIQKDPYWQKAKYDPRFFACTYLQTGLHRGQALWLKRSEQNENLLHAGNRWGKGEVQAVKFLHRAVFQPVHLGPFRWACRRAGSKFEYRLVNVSITQNQAELVFRKILRRIRGNRFLESLVAEQKRTPFPLLRFENGSEISARTTQRKGEYLLGEGYDFINFDEAAFDPAGEYVADKVLALRLADRGGMLDFTSTPKGKNWFYRRAQKLKRNPYWGYVQQGDSRENRYINQHFLKKWMQNSPELLIRQNVYGEFVEDEESLLSNLEIEEALAASKGLSPPVEGRKYAAGWDLGRKISFTTGAILDVTEKPCQLVDWVRFRHKSWEQVFQTIRQKKRDYPGPLILDATGLGDVVLDELKDIKPEGFKFTQKTKNALLMNFKRAHEKRELAYPHLEQWEDADNLWTLKSELESLTWENDNRQADFFFALALALWVCRPREEIILPYGKWAKI
ncbi:MAG TPA: terminase family protein [Verrucomicrobiae bacterium]|nr:terminase family protein [Verrucomicrobiae bacterium]